VSLNVVDPATAQALAEYAAIVWVFMIDCLYSRATYCRTQRVPYLRAR
jgi:hypothetical protein